MLIVEHLSPLYVSSPCTVVLLYVKVVQGMNYRLTMEVHYEKVYICNVFLYFPLPINGVATDPVLKENESSCHLVNGNDGVDKL